LPSEYKLLKIDSEAGVPGFNFPVFEERMMSKFLMTLATVAFGTIATAAEPQAGLKKGTPEVKSITALAFGPDGLLFVGDPQSSTIFAIATNDTEPAGKDDVKIEKIDDKLGSLLGTTAANITISDVKVNPTSGNVYLAVTRKGAGGGAIIAKLDRAGKLSEFSLKDVESASVKIPNASEKQRLEAITSMAFVDGKVIVAGLSNEEFASTLRAIPYPFSTTAQGASVEIFHGAHGAFETKSPIRTFTPFKISGAEYLLAAYTCTPLVKVPVADLKAGSKVKGTTIAELGNRNRPLDMIAYNKDKKDFILLANSARGVMKISTEGIADIKPIVKKTDVAGLSYETIKELKGVQQLDKLDAGRALLLVQAEDKSLSLKTIPLP